MIVSPIQEGGMKFKVAPKTATTASNPPSDPAPGGPGGPPPPPPPPGGPGGPPPPPPPPGGPTTGAKKKFKVAAGEKKAPEGEPTTRKEILEQFYKGRRENPDRYTYSDDGNLVILDQTGKPSKTIPMQRFRSLTSEEVIELLRQRLEEVRKYEVGTKEPAAEEKKEESEEKPKGELSYVDAIANLRTIYTRFKRGDSDVSARDVKDANVKVMEAEQRRNKALYPIDMRYIEGVNNPMIKSILLDSKDERRMRTIVSIYRHFPFEKKDAYGHYMTPEEEAALAQKAAMKGGAAIDVVLIETYDDPSRGFLHPAYTKDFSYTSTQYSSVYQAYEVERLKLLKNQALVDQLMKTRSPRTIASIAAQDPTPIPNSYDLWFSILKAFYQQNTDLGKKLLETGSAIFSLRDSTMPTPSEYLRALMSVRSLIAEKQEGGAVAPIESHVITEEEQKKAKVGAIINARRTG